MKWWMLLTVLSLAGMLGGRAAGLGAYGIVFKMIASTGFIAAAVAAGGLQTNYGRAVLVALFFSWWGDLFLALPGNLYPKDLGGNWFLCGLVAFLIGHLAFGAAFLVYGVQWRWVAASAVALVGVCVAVYFWLGDGPGAMRVPVYAYMGVISAMVALSFGARGAGASWWFVVGAVGFYCSDLFVARQAFVAPGPINGLIGLPLYFGAQLVFAYTCKLVR